MEEKIRQIVYGVLCDESRAFTGSREIGDITVKHDDEANVDIITVTAAVESANDIEARVAMEDAMRDAVKAAFPDARVRIILTDIAGEEEPACAHASHGAHGHHDMPAKKRIPGVKTVYLVCSAKGGVGKSTVALNTALALKQAGRSVGLLDLDLYGPSLPSLVGSDLPPIVVGNLIVPPEIHGLSVLSIGFMIDKDQPLLWRGPMVAGVINQLLFEVDWSGHDTLVVDMPPGTGDTYLTILQTIEVDAAILVTTPSEIALADTKRGVGVFEPYGVPVAGIVENMATYDWEGRETVLRLLENVKTADDASAQSLDRARRMVETTKSIRIFGNRTQSLCDGLKLPLIASIPLDIALQNDNDAGTPYMLNPKKEAIRSAFADIAAFIVKREDATSAE